MVNPENVVKTLKGFDCRITAELNDCKLSTARKEIKKMSEYFKTMLSLASANEKYELIKMLDEQQGKNFPAEALKGVIFAYEFVSLFDMYANTMHSSEHNKSEEFLKKDIAEVLMSTYADNEKAAEVANSMMVFTINVFQEFEHLKLLNKLKKVAHEDIKGLIELFK